MPRVTKEWDINKEGVTMFEKEAEIKQKPSGKKVVIEKIICELIDLKE